jgi:putative aldouronate transport system permease protein
MGLMPRARRVASGRMTLLAMALPCFLLLIAFSYLPLAGWVYALFDSTTLKASTFVGLKYVRAALLSPAVHAVLLNTVAISILNVAFGVLPVGLAILISELVVRRQQRAFQTLLTLPYFISWVLVYSLMYALFSSEGMVNQLLHKIAPAAGSVNVLANANAAWFVQALFALWKTAGWNAIIYLAAITGIDPTLYEAAVVDGAGRYRRILHITLPGLAETYVVLLLLSIAGMLTSGFDQFYVFNNPMVSRRLNVLDYYVYMVGIHNNLIPVATAISIYKTVISIVLLALANLVARRVRGAAIL